MASYKLTPYQRRIRAQERAAQYAARRQPTYQSVARDDSEEEDVDGLTKTLHTVGDVGANVLTGVGKGLEGIVDFGAGLVGAVGGIFSDDFQDSMQDFIARDHTGELYGNAWQEALEHSALNDSKVGQIVEGVAQGVGQMLPAVAMSVATGGVATALGAAAKAASAAGQIAALTTTMASAAGTGTEQAFQDGANYGQGLLYGTATGALEGVTERLTGGVKLYGGGWLDNVARAGAKGVGKKVAKEAAEEVAEVGIKRIAKDMIGEGAEEVIAELANPLAKTIYKGKDALSEYGEGDYWKGVVDAGIIGAGTSFAYGGTVGHVTKQSGVYADATSVAEHVDEQRKKRANPNLTQAEKVQIEKNIKKDNEVLSRQLQKLSDKSRARVMKARPELSAVFEADGTIKAEQLAALDANIEAAADTTYDARYRSSTLGKATIEKVLANGSTSTEKAVAFSGELDAEGQASLSHLQETAGAVAYRSGDTARFLVAENVPEGRSYYDVDNKVAVISVEDLKKGNASSTFVRDIVADTYFGDVIHEVGHGIEDTHSGEMLDRHLKSNEGVYNLAIEDMFKRGYMSEFYNDFDTAKADVQRIMSKVSEGDTLTTFEQKVYDTFKSETFAFASQRVLGNEAFAKKLVQIDPSGVEKILAKINELRENLKNRRSPEAKKTAEYLRTAEKLYLNAISEMGGAYKNGRIHLANREDEEENASRAVDESGEMRYNERTNLGNVKLARKVTKYIPYSKVGYNNISFIRQNLNKLYEGVEDGVADGIAIEKDGKVYIVDSGCESGEVTFGVRKVRSISDSQFRAQVVRRTNDDALSKGYVSDELSSRVRDGYDNDSGRSVRRESGEELSVDTRKSQDHEGGVLGEDGDRRGKVKLSRKITPLKKEDLPAYLRAGGRRNKSKVEALSRGKKIILTTSEETRSFINQAIEGESDLPNVAYGKVPDYLATEVAQYSKGDITIKDNYLEFVPDDLEHAYNEHLSAKDKGDINLTKEDFEKIPEYIETYDELVYAIRYASGNTKVCISKKTEDGRIVLIHAVSKSRGSLNFKNMIGVSEEKYVSEYQEKYKKKGSPNSRGSKSSNTSLRDGTASSDIISDTDPVVNTFEQKTFEKAKRSRNISDEKVTLSKGELAALRANYHGDKVFTKKSVTEALKGIDAMQKIPAQMRNEFINRLWKGYNERLNDQGFELYTEIMWHKIHAAVLQETGFEMTEDEITQMDGQIVAALHQIVDSGKPSIKAKLESETSVEGYRKEATYWRNEHNRAVERHKLLGRCLHEARKLRDAKAGAYLNASRLKNEGFKHSIEELGKINFRGNLNVSGTRRILGGIAAWYTRSNPIYQGATEGDAGRFRQDIKDMLDELADPENGALTNEDLQKLETVLKYFNFEIDNFHTIVENGKRVEAVSIAKRYISGIQEARRVALKSGIIRSLTQNKFAMMVADPAMLMRQADGYMDGFFSEQFEKLREGEIEAAVLEQEFSEEFQRVFDDKAYAKRYNEAMVTYEGKEISLQSAISLYMTLQRGQAQAGLYYSGFDILEDEQKRTFSRGSDVKLSAEELAEHAKQSAKALEAQFTAEDKHFIRVMETAMEKCREIKIRIDEMLQGYSNVTKGYYWPIARTQIAKNVDMFSVFEGDRVSSLSMNKDTVRGAKNALLIEPAHIVFMRHIKATSLYSGLGVFTDNFNRLYNLNVNGEQVKEVSQEKAAREYASAPINSDIIDLIDKVKRGEHAQNDLVDLGVVSKFIAQEIKKITGIDFTGYKILLEARQIEHIIKDHGENGKTDHSMADDRDIAKMLFAIAAPEKIVDGGRTEAYSYMVNGRNRTAKTILYERSIGEKSYYVAQTAVDTKKKTLYIVSAFIGTSGYKNGAPQLTNAQGPSATSEIAIAETPTRSIAQNNAVVNSFSKTNHNRPTTIKSTLEDVTEATRFAKMMVDYFMELKANVEGISTKQKSVAVYNDAVGYIRSAYAKYQLGANPKVWLTQLSSLIAASDILDTSCITKGFGGFVSKQEGAEVDKYCRLAWLRNVQDDAARAQTVSTKDTNALVKVGGAVGRGLSAVGDLAMKPIGAVDRRVICALFRACQYQVQKNNGPKVGTKENKVQAGKLLTRVILETQQNSLATERSAAMRSSDELLKGFTMFSADAMKVGARFVDAYGEREALKARLKMTTDPEERRRLEAQIEKANKRCVRASAALVGTALFNAMIAYAFKWLYRRDDEETIESLLADTIGNMFGGIPFLRDAVGFMTGGFEVNNFFISSFNDLLSTASDTFKLLETAASGEEISKREALSAMRKVLYAAGQLAGLPVRNLYNVTTGIVNRISPETGYILESHFYSQAYSRDLAKAIEAGDERMVETIAGLMLDEKISIEDTSTRKALLQLLEKGYDVLPRSVGDSVTVDGETLEFTGRQRKRFAEVYAVGDEALADMVKLSKFKSADEAVRAKAVRFIYDMYWQLALQDITGGDMAQKNVLFAEAIDIEKLAIIIATARSIEADKDRDGKAISGSKKRKIQAFINSLHLTAAQKYMVMGYLGYSNLNGEAAVKRYIGSLKLTKAEKASLLAYSGYAA